MGNLPHANVASYLSDDSKSKLSVANKFANILVRRNPRVPWVPYYPEVVQFPSRSGSWSVFFIVATYLSNLKFIHCSLFPWAQAGGGTQLSISGFTSAVSVTSRTLFRGGLRGQPSVTLGGQQSITTGFQNRRSNPLLYVNNSKLTTAIVD